MVLTRKEKRQLQDLARKAKRGDRESFEKLVLLTQDRILAHCWRILQDEDEAADAAQETFVKAWFKLNQFDSRRRFLPWLYQIATNNCLDILRRAKRLVRFDQMEVGGEIWQREKDDPNRAIRAEEVRKAVAQLPKRYRAALSLYYFEEYRYREIAEIMGAPINTVKSWIRRGKEKLKKLIVNKQVCSSRNSEKLKV